MYKVLIVDDEKMAREGLCEDVDWKKMGFEVAGAAKNGKEGYALALSSSPDLILCDIRMPGCSGIEMMDALREKGCEAQVIFLTAYEEFEYARDAIRLRAVDYLLKPFEDEELEEAVDKAKKRIETSRQYHVPQVEETGSYSARTISYINAHYADMTLSVADIAEDLKVSEGHLSRLFRKETGTTVSSYITNVRLNKARLILSNVTVRISDAAKLCGYSDTAYFSSAFRKQFGVSPKEYQKR